MNSLLPDSVDGEFDGDTVGVAIVRAVARERGVSPTDLPALYEWVDPEVLDAFCESVTDGRSRSGRLEFTYDGHAVVVDCTGGVSVTIDGRPLSSVPSAEADDSSPA